MMQGVGSLIQTLHERHSNQNEVIHFLTFPSPKNGGGTWALVSWILPIVHCAVSAVRPLAFLCYTISPTVATKCLQTIWNLGEGVLEACTEQLIRTRLGRSFSYF